MERIVARPEGPHGGGCARLCTRHGAAHRSRGYEGGRGREGSGYRVGQLEPRRAPQVSPAVRGVLGRLGKEKPYRAEGLRQPDRLPEETAAPVAGRPYTIPRVLAGYSARFKGSPMERPPLVDRISIGVGHALSLLFLVAVLFTVFEVVMRYAFNAPTIWVHDMVIVLSALCFIFGGPLACQQRSHIQMASYFEKAPPKVRAALDQLCHLLGALFLALFLYGALKIAIPSVELMETSGRAWDVPIPAFLKVALVIGAALLLVHTLSDIWHRAPVSPL